jgi:hypothetical protein
VDNCVGIQDVFRTLCGVEVYYRVYGSSSLVPVMNHTNRDNDPTRCHFETNLFTERKIEEMGQLSQ